MEKQQATQASRTLTLCFCSSVRTSLRTFAHGISSGHQMGLQLSLPQPGLPRPVEYLSISGINARSWAWKTKFGHQQSRKTSGIYLCLPPNSKIDLSREPMPRCRFWSWPNLASSNEQEKENCRCRCIDKITNSQNSPETPSPSGHLECSGRNLSLKKINCPRFSAGDGRSDLSGVSLSDFCNEWEIIHKVKHALCEFVFHGTQQRNLSCSRLFNNNFRTWRKESLADPALSSLLYYAPVSLFPSSLKDTDMGTM